MSTLGRKLLPTNLVGTHETYEANNGDVEATAERFAERFQGKDANTDDRKSMATTLTNEYYDLVTDLYEYGWGQAFHFAPRYEGEAIPDSFARHEFMLAMAGKFKAGDQIIDVGCGVGGPLRNIARFTQAHVTGINNNAYQISRAKKHDAQFGLSAWTDYLKTDFNNMPLPDNSKDGAFAIEAICHTRDHAATFAEILRVLKPGARLASYEWLVTDKFDKTNATHKEILDQILIGNGLPDLMKPGPLLEALKKAGFIIETAVDLAEQFEATPVKTIPWYDPLAPSYNSLFGLRTTPVGRWVTSKMLAGLEAVRLAPKGSVAATKILEDGAVGLVRGGQAGIFTPCFLIVARKPNVGEAVPA